MINMNPVIKVNYLVFFFSLVLGVFLELLPVPVWANWFRPDWLLLIAFFWIMSAPETFNVFFAWILGLVIDATKGSLLGEHAFAMLITAFLFLKLQRRFKLYSLWQQSACVLLLAFVYEFIIFLIQGTINQLPTRYEYWGACLTTMLFWPSLSVLLKDWNKKFTRKIG
jgi:rod shape-determining protein MreD